MPNKVLGTDVRDVHAYQKITFKLDIKQTARFTFGSEKLFDRISIPASHKRTLSERQGSGVVLNKLASPVKGLAFSTSRRKTDSRKRLVIKGWNLNA